MKRDFGKKAADAIFTRVELVNGRCLSWRDRKIAHKFILRVLNFIPRARPFLKAIDAREPFMTARDSGPSVAQGALIRTGRCSHRMRGRTRCESRDENRIMHITNSYFSFYMFVKNPERIKIRERETWMYTTCLKC